MLVLRSLPIENKEHGVFLTALLRNTTSHIYIRHPGGVAIFDSNFEGGYQNFTVPPGGGEYAFFTGIFPEKDHPPPLREILNSP